LPLDGEVPALHRPGWIVPGCVVHARPARIVLGAVQKVSGESVLGSKEAAARLISGTQRLPTGRDSRRYLRLRHALNERSREAQNIFSAHAVEMDVTDAVAAAQHSLRCELIGSAQSRPEVIAVRFYQGAIVK